MTTANAILVFAKSGVVTHRFCPESEAREELEKIAAAGNGGSMMATDGMEAELVFQISPDLRERVEAAKAKLRYHLRIKTALDDNEIPADRDLRLKIFTAFRQLQSAS